MNEIYAANILNRSKIQGRQNSHIRKECVSREPCARFTAVVSKDGHRQSSGTVRNFCAKISGQRRVFSKLVKCLHLNKGSSKIKMNITFSACLTVRKCMVMDREKKKSVL